MSESRGILLCVNCKGQLSTPTIMKENGEVVMPDVAWEHAVNRMIILGKVNTNYTKLLKELQVSTK